VSLRDRFFTRPVARAVTSPSGILLAGAGVSVGVVAGLPVLAAVGIGAAAWAVRVAVAMPRRDRGPRIDPLALKEPWRRYVWEARKDQRRFEQAIRDLREGPLRDRLAGIGERIDTAVAECWQVARAGQDLVEARKQVDAEGAFADLERLGGPAAASQHPPDSHLGRTAAALQAQLDTARRLDETINELHARLSLLDARLGEAVSRAIELSARSGSESVTGLGGLDADVGSLVGELEALRQALDETSTASLSGPVLPGPAVGGPATAGTAPPGTGLPGPTQPGPTTPGAVPDPAAPTPAPGDPGTGATAAGDVAGTSPPGGGAPPPPPGQTQPPGQTRPSGGTEPPEEGRPAPGAG
jgi:hypothetical protein